MNGQLWWFVARAGGIVSWSLLAGSVAWGLALSSKAFGRRPRPAWLLDLHRFLGGLAGVFTAVHVAAIMLDSYVSFGLTDVLVPLTSKWHPVAVAWGVVGLYLLVAVELTSLARRWLPRRLWRAVHLASFPLFVTATVHGLSAGTDAHGPSVFVGITAVAAITVALVAVRLEARRPAARPVFATAVRRAAGSRAQPPR